MCFLPEGRETPCILTAKGANNTSHQWRGLQRLLCNTFLFASPLARWQGALTRKAGGIGRCGSGVFSLWLVGAGENGMNRGEINHTHSLPRLGSVNLHRPTSNRPHGSKRIRRLDLILGGRERDSRVDVATGEAVRRCRDSPPSEIRIERRPRIE